MAHDILRRWLSLLLQSLCFFSNLSASSRRSCFISSLLLSRAAGSRHKGTLCSESQKNETMAEAEAEADVFYFVSFHFPPSRSERERKKTAVSSSCSLLLPLTFSLCLLKQTIKKQTKIENPDRRARRQGRQAPDREFWNCFPEEFSS